MFLGLNAQLNVARELSYRKKILSLLLFFPRPIKSIKNIFSKLFLNTAITIYIPFFLLFFLLLYEKLKICESQFF